MSETNINEIAWNVKNLFSKKKKRKQFNMSAENFTQSAKH